MQTSSNLFHITIILYAFISYLIFKKVHNTTHTVIDEEFHIPQGLAYCNFNFTTWDSKITTLPGLYVLSSILLGPLHLCSTYWLRFVNYLTGLINLSLFYIWFNLADKNVPQYQKLLSSFNLSILPPLYFFNNVYYTDVVSIMSIMLLLIFNRLNKHIIASSCGLISVIIRQTNIIWVSMVFGDYVLKQFYHYCIKTKFKKHHLCEITLDDIKELDFHHFKNIFHLRNVPKEIWLNIYSYFATLFIFVIFLIYNGGVVVGDKTAHTAVIHIPQFFYFSLFCLIFAGPHFLHLIIPFFKFIFRNIFCTTSILIIMVIIIHLNTLVHPYLLADNRHYTFYIWNRLYQNIFIFRYVMALAYLFGVYSGGGGQEGPRFIMFELFEKLPPESGAPFLEPPEFHLSELPEESPCLQDSLPHDFWGGFALLALKTLPCEE